MTKTQIVSVQCGVCSVLGEVNTMRYILEIGQSQVSAPRTRVSRLFFCWWSGAGGFRHDWDLRVCLLAVAPISISLSRCNAVVARMLQVRRAETDALVSGCPCCMRVNESCKDSLDSPASGHRGVTRSSPIQTNAASRQVDRRWGPRVLSLELEYQ